MNEATSANATSTSLVRETKGHPRGVAGRWVLILSLVIAVYLITYLALPHLFSGFVRTYVAQPILWCSLCAAVLLASRSPAGKLRFAKSFVWLGLLLGVFQIACLVIAGLVYGFGDSPYSHRAYPIFLSFAFWASALVAIEFSRAFLLERFSRRHTTLVVGIITLLFAVTMVPLARFIALTRGGDPMPFLGGTFLPLLAENLLAAFLVLLGGPLSAIAYRGTLDAFEWLSPILPNLTWTVKAFAATLAPIIGFMLAQTVYPTEHKPEPQSSASAARKRSPVISWMVTIIAAVVIMWLSFGLLGLHPVTIVSGSMKPTINVGDLAIVREVPTDAIRVGDVIQFRQGDSTSVHRVVDIQKESNPVFITKGDANDKPDSQPVQADQVLGRVQFCIPKLGWVPLGVKQLIGAVF